MMFENSGTTSAPRYLALLFGFIEFFCVNCVSCVLFS